MEKLEPRREMTLTLRPATQADAQLLFDWRNDPVTRRNSIDTGEVAWHDHVRWLAASLSRSDRQLLIAERGVEPVGTVRLDHVGDRCTLSWTVAPSQRGRGIGKAMVQRTVIDADVAILFAMIKTDNIASIHIAETCGFKRVSCRDALALYRRG
jgi:RimJ/RimL family protein N-acetyltransferase